MNILDRSLSWVKNNILLLIIVAFSLILRLVFLTQENIWFDEFFSLRAALSDVKGFDLLQFLGPIPYLYFFLLKLWIGLFGYSLFTIRLLSVLFGVGSVVLIYALGKMCFDRPTGLISAFLLSVHPAHLFYSQEVRHYSLYLLLTLLVYYFFSIYLKKEANGKMRLFLFAGSIFLLLNTHFFAVFILLALNIASFFCNNK